MVFSLDMIDPELVHDLVLMEPNYEKNRNRTAALVHQGFSLWDKYQAAKPFLFGTSLAIAAGSGYMWWRRGWWKKGRRVGEAHVLYPATLLVSAVVAWLTRPGGKPALPPPTTMQSPAPMGDVVIEHPQFDGFVEYLDKKVSELKQQDPHFANRALSRLVNIPGIKSYWDATPEQIQAFLHYDPKGIYRR